MSASRLDELAIVFKHFRDAVLLDRGPERDEQPLMRPRISLYFDRKRGPASVLYVPIYLVHTSQACNGTFPRLPSLDIRNFDATPDALTM